MAWVVHVREDIPDEFSLIIGDAVHNIRCALDLFACALVRANGFSESGVYFPIARDAIGLEEIFKKTALKKATQEARRFIGRLNPHRGDAGNWVLSGIHDLDKLDKHRLIIAVAGIAQFDRIISGLRNGSVIATAPMFPWGRLENGAILLRPVPDEHFKVGDEIGATYQIAFRTGQPFESAEVVPTLLQCAQYVRAVLDSATPP